MPFKELLNTLVGRVPGAQGAILADWEGEAVAQVGVMDDYELKVIGAHKGVVLHNMREVADRLGNDLREVVITTKQSQTLIMPVTKDYYLVLTLDRSDMLGMALLEARRCVQALHREIA